CSRVATGPVRSSPELFTIVAARPVVPVAVNVTGLPVSVPDVAERVFGPAVGPRVHDVTAAIPLAFVVTGVAGVTEPPPDATANVTPTPATGFPFASRTTTEGFTGTVVPAVAVWPSPPLLAIWVAAPTAPVAVNVTGLPVSPLAVAVSEFGPAVGPRVHEVTAAIPLPLVVTGVPVSPLAVAVRVFGPAVGARVHEVTAAIPLGPVVTGVVGLTVPPPEATANVTLTPATGFPFASRTITDGSTATGVPAVAV